MGNQPTKEQDGEIDISHFKLLQVIGKGGFGMVRIVQKRDSKMKYALKYIRKKNCIKRNAVQHIFRERIILEELDHPFIVNLQFAFQDDEHMFMVLDLATGGDVRFHLKTIGILPEQTCQIYAAEIISALAYIHSKNIVHRDIKPENILLDEKGHVHISDFNVAVLLSERIPNSRSGTAAYLAPEMLNGEPYTFSVDWWALGVTLYECTYNKYPFFAGKGLTLNNAIRKGRFKLLEPKDMHPNNRYSLVRSETRDDFITRLLSVSIKDRLGCGSEGAQELFNHPWLSHIDQQKLEKFGYKPEFVPSKNQNNYDLTPALEELLYDSSPLGSKPIRKKKEKSNSNGSNSIWKSAFGKSGRDSEKEAKKAHFQNQMDLIEQTFKPYVKETGMGFLDRQKLLRVSKLMDLRPDQDSQSPGGSRQYEKPLQLDTNDSDSFNDSLVGKGPRSVNANFENSIAGNVTDFAYKDAQDNENIAHDPMNAPEPPTRSDSLEFKSHLKYFPQKAVKRLLIHHQSDKKK